MSNIKNYLKKHKKVFVVGIIVAVLFILVAFRYAYSVVSSIFMGNMMRQAMVAQVTLETIDEADILETFEAPGRVRAKYDIDLVARVSGYLQKSHFKEGDYVKKGQTLFTIEQQEYINAVQKAQASLKSAEAQAQKAKVDFARAKELVEKDFISKATYDDRLAQRDVSIANVQSARAALSDAKRNLSYTKITSPVDGKIGAIIITEGNYVTAQSGALAKITSINPIYVLYSLDSKKFNQFRSETNIQNDKPFEVELELADGTIYDKKGVQDFFDNTVTTSTGTLSLRATFENPDNVLIPGDFVKVKVLSNTTKKHVVVPQDSVLQDASGKYVYTVVNDKAKLVRISTEGQFEDYWIVEKGLKKGDKVVKEGALKLTDGAKVKVLTEKSYQEENK